jgi:hypothetical protein
MNHRDIIRLLIVIGLVAFVELYAGGIAAAGTRTEVAALSATDGLPGIRFLHVATISNLSGNSTFIDHPLTNGNPNAIIFVTQNWNLGNVGGIYNNHVIGVWYSTVGGKWAIFNQDLSAMQVGAAFNVLIPDPGPNVFVHTTTAGNTGTLVTLIDHPLTNNNPDAVLMVTRNWNPGGIGGVYYDHPMGAYYEDGLTQKWALAAPPIEVVPLGLAFNILVLDPASNVLMHQATAGNISSNSTYIDHPLTNNNPNALLFVTIRGFSNLKIVGVWYDSLQGKWAIFNQNASDMIETKEFNVLIPISSAFFTHKATTGNSSGNSTYLDQTLLNGVPNAVAFVTQNWNPGGVGGTYNSHPVGVWYFSGQWLVFNEDGASMPQNASFNVLVPNMDAGVFVHKATAGNSSANSTFIEHPLTDNDPDAIIFVTQNWNPGGVGGTYNSHPVGVWYSDLGGQWAIFNEDNVNMPVGASFNALVPISDTNVFVHEATVGNSSGNSTYLDHPLLNGRPDAKILITQNWNPGGGLGGTYNAHSVGMWYSVAAGRWAVFNEDGAAMPAGAAFNVLVEPAGIYLPLVLRGF